MLNKIEISKLRVFKEVYTSLNLHRASENLHISASAVSQSLKNLESDLGLQLFVRSKKSVLPTKQADLLFEKIAPALQSLLNGLDQFIRGDRLEAHLIRIGADETIGKNLLLSHLKRWEKEFNLSIQLFMSSPAELLSRLRRAELDFLFTNQEILQKGIEAKLKRKQGKIDGQILVAHEQYWRELNLKQTLKVEDLLNIPHIAESSSALEFFYLTQFGVIAGQLENKIISSNLESRVMAVNQKLGIGLFWESEVSKYLEKNWLKLPLVGKQKEFHLNIYHLEGLRPQGPVEDFLNEIKYSILKEN